MSVTGSHGVFGTATDGRDAQCSVGRLADWKRALMAAAGIAEATWFELKVEFEPLLGVLVLTDVGPKIPPGPGADLAQRLEELAPRMDAQFGGMAATFAAGLRAAGRAGESVTFF